MEVGQVEGVEQYSWGLRKEEERAGGGTTPCAVHAIRFSNLLSVVWAGAEKPAPIIRGLLCVKLELRTLSFCLKCKVRISYVLL